jgi:2-polyprenyl-6-methoxyphenol hydroxylase-like FAD-dependent oxidoreductase
VLAEIRARALGEVHPRLAELVAATPEPFLQTIVDIGVSRTVFGRACLLGDAAFVVRPHTAAAAAKAADDAMSLAAAIHRAGRNVDAALAGWQASQIERGQELLQYGVALGQRWAKGALKEEAFASGVQRRVNLPPTHLRSLTDDERRTRTDGPDPLGRSIVVAPDLSDTQPPGL